MISFVRFVVGFVAFSVSSSSAYAFQSLTLECRNSNKKYAFSEIRFTRYVDDRTRLNIGTAAGAFVGEKTSRDFTSLIQSDEVCVIRQKVRFECRGSDHTERFVQVQFRKATATVTWGRTYPLQVHAFRSLNDQALPLHQIVERDALCVLSADE